MYYYLQEDNEFYGIKGSYIGYNLYNALPESHKLLFGTNNPIEKKENKKGRISYQKLEYDRIVAGINEALARNQGIQEDNEDDEGDEDEVVEQAIGRAIFGIDPLDPDF